MNRRRSSRHWQGRVLLLLTISLFAVLILRFQESTESVTDTLVSGQPPVDKPSATISDALKPVQSQTEFSDNHTEEHIALPQQNDVLREKQYSEESYHLVSDMVYLYRTNGVQSAEEVGSLLDCLSSVDLELGLLWTDIMKTWMNVNETYEPVNKVPDDLPEDESLCFAVLGFQLLQNGEMAPELLGRCETALSCLQKYPNSLVLLCGGPTASGNRQVSEAEVMAEWLLHEGIASDRMIIENRSLTTVENAAFACQILAEQYSGIHSLVMISSDYHLPLGILLFQEAACLWNYKNGNQPYDVVSSVAFMTGIREDFDLQWQSSDLWSLADPSY